jgi:hypothetical protein
MSIMSMPSTSNALSPRSQIINHPLARSQAIAIDDVLETSSRDADDDVMSL